MGTTTDEDPNAASTAAATVLLPEPGGPAMPRMRR